MVFILIPVMISNLTLLILQSTQHCCIIYTNIYYSLAIRRIKQAVKLLCQKVAKNVKCAAGHTEVAGKAINQDNLSEVCRKPRKQGHCGHNMFYWLQW